MCFFFLKKWLFSRSFGGKLFFYSLPPSQFSYASSFENMRWGENCVVPVFNKKRFFRFFSPYICLPSSSIQKRWDIFVKNTLARKIRALQLQAGQLRRTFALDRTPQTDLNGYHNLVTRTIILFKVFSACLIMFFFIF